VSDKAKKMNEVNSKDRESGRKHYRVGVALLYKQARYETSPISAGA
jgi:hypothetical protein